MTTKRRPARRRKPPGSTLFAQPKRRREDTARYVIKYRAPHPCVRPEQLPTLSMTVRGRQNMQSSRAILRASGYTIVSVRELWLGIF